MKKIYFAAPLFNEMELERNKKYTDIFRSWGYDVYLPQESAGLSARIIAAGGNTYEVSKNIFETDLNGRSEEHTSELQSRGHLVCRLLLEKKKKKQNSTIALQTNH